MADRTVTTVAVIGTGLLGRGIAKVIARAGYPLVLHDSSTQVLAAAREQVAESARSSAVSVHAEPHLGKAVAAADLVIEAVLEDLGLKQELFECMSAASVDALLMSNSSVLPIGKIAARAVRPERTVGTHWWNPPHLIPIVEVIRGPRTSEAVMQRTCEFLGALGKTPVRVERDVPGFVGNRLQHALWREALALVSHGVCAPERADRIVAASLGHSLAQRGPFAEMNRVGLAQVADDFAAVLPLINCDPHPAPLLRAKVSQGQLGAKVGQGFLTWPAGARERAAEKLQTHVERRLKTPLQASANHGTVCAEDAAIERQLRTALWREALALVEDRVCDAATVDLVATNTIGLRLAVMGPIENADYVGLDLTLAIHEAVLPSLNASLDVPERLRRAVKAGAPL